MKGEYLKLETVKAMAELLKENEQLREEIERLNSIIKDIAKERCNLRTANEIDENAIHTLQHKNNKLNNIIKEVREYIMTNGIHSDYGDKGIDDENKLLEILDKGE